MAKFGLAQARRSILSLSSIAIQESGLTTTLQRLVERSNVAGRLRCDFRSNRIPEESLPATVQHQLLRIAQEAISNAVRHAKPKVVSVTLRWEQPNLILQVTDNGSGISRASLEKSEGFGLSGAVAGEAGIAAGAPDRRSNPVGRPASTTPAKSRPGIRCSVVCFMVPATFLTSLGLIEAAMTRTSAVVSPTAGAATSASSRNGGIAEGLEPYRSHDLFLNHID
jgi:Histidine kinase-, DNA gyrase B-, and HSP90-like ATPase